MNEKIDLAKMTDITALKALAYDQLAVLENAKMNLTAINQRMTQLSETPNKEVVSE